MVITKYIHLIQVELLLLLSKLQVQLSNILLSLVEVLEVVAGILEVGEGQEVIVLLPHFQ